MPRTFHSPSEFLEYIQTTGSQSVPIDESDEIYEGMTKAGWNEIGGMPFEKDRAFESWIDQLILLIESALTSSELST